MTEQLEQNQVDFPDKKYNIIYADPPWSYSNKIVNIWNISGSPSYNTLTQNKIKELPVKSISAKNSILFLWAVVPQLPEAFEVMNSWGFKYKTMLTWHKTYNKFGGKGMGYWFRGQTEHLLLGIKGNVKAFRSVKPNHYSYDVIKHSQKPHKFRELIVEASGDLPRIELFARERYIGWDSWGEQLENKIQESLTQ